MQLTQTNTPSITVDLHGLPLTFQSPDTSLRQRFEVVYGHLPRLNHPQNGIFIGWHIHKLPTAPLPPPGVPVIVEDKLVSYYGNAALVSIRMPKYGLITVDFNSHRIIGAVTQSCLDMYGAFEDVLMISLAPLYRRRGWFPLHAFAALAPNNKAAIITGQMGAGKTTTGLALLTAGWKLLSNDSPLLRLHKETVEVLAYPGRLSAFDDSLARFAALQKFIPAASQPQPVDLLAPSGPQKRVFRAEDAFEQPWATAGPVSAIYFPQVVPGLVNNELVRLEPKEAVLQLMPQAIEGWDKAAISQTLHLLSVLTKEAPAYVLRLSPQVAQLPALITQGLQ